MTETEATRDNGLDIGFGKLRVGARGVGVLAFLAIAVITGAQLYSGWRIEQTFGRIVTEMHAEHRSISASMNVQTCLNSYSYDERIGLRTALTHARGQKEAFEVLTAWCPWLTAAF